MDTNRKYPGVWGLTGGIGSGKSLAASILRSLGVPVLDMDRLAAGLMVPGTAVFHEIVHKFGNGVLAGDKTIDRRTLAEIVFNDAARLRDLESIVHPATLAETFRRLDGDTLRGAPFVFVESAIVFDVGLHKWLGRVAVVTANTELRIRRVVRRDNVSEKDVAARIAAQMGDDMRIRLADAVWVNDGPARNLRSQIIDTLCPAGQKKDVIGD